MIRNPGLVLVAGLVALLAGCEKKEGGPGGGAAKQVRLGYFANVTHAQAVLGMSSGEIQQAVAPAEVNTKVFNAGPSLVEALFAGEIDIGYIGPGPAISAFVKSKGQGLRIVAGAAANGVLIVARKDAGINTLADLKGKKIATPQLGNTQDIAARRYVLKVLGQKDANNVIPIANAEQAGMMARKEIDAAWAPEPWGSRLLAEKDADAKLVADEKELWPGGQSTLTVVITTPEFLKAHPEAVEKVLRVHRSWTARLQKEPQKYAVELGEALFKLTGKRLPAGVLGEALGRVSFTDDPLEGALKTMAQWSYEAGIAKDPVAIEGLVDLSLLKKLQGEK
jgi:NitT/TauT family transport system substrate-binding protein